MAPDPDSRTPDHEGRRIEAIDGGWMLLNHGKFREIISLDQRREKAAERQRRFKAHQRKSNAQVTLGNAGNAQVTPVTTSDQIRSDQIRSDQDQKKQRGAANAAPPSPGVDSLAVLSALNTARKLAIPGARALPANKRSLEHIAARLKDGYSFEDCKHVIAVCMAEVQARPDTAKWFNTVSPFRADNFARKLGGDPSSTATTGSGRYFGDIEAEGDMTHALGNFLPAGHEDAIGSGGGGRRGDAAKPAQGGPDGTGRV
jgi:hypothetical protein